jgi:hypothetical protein
MRYLVARSVRVLLVSGLLLGLGLALGCGAQSSQDVPSGQPSARLKKFEAYKAKAQKTK